MILEVMGRDAGHIALASGIAGGADIILIPEIPYDMEKVIAKINEVEKREQNFALMVVSEAVKAPDGQKIMVTDSNGKSRYGGIGTYLAEQISEHTNIEARTTVLGHVQRGSPPTYRDRLLATAFGVKAVDLIESGSFDRMVTWKNRTVVDIPIADAIAAYHAVNLDDIMVHTARALGISFGDE
jgi:6-phosphofructokinase 1